MPKPPETIYGDRHDKDMDTGSKAILGRCPFSGRVGIAASWFRLCVHPPPDRFGSAPPDLPEAAHEATAGRIIGIRPRVGKSIKREIN